jgi:hypothetical protein
MRSSSVVVVVALKIDCLLIAYWLNITQNLFGDD